MSCRPQHRRRQSAQNARLTAQLWYWTRKSGLGIAFDSSAGFTLPNAAIRSPGRLLDDPRALGADSAKQSEQKILPHLPGFRRRACDSHS